MASTRTHVILHASLGMLLALVPGCGDADADADADPSGSTTCAAPTCDPTPTEIVCAAGFAPRTDHAGCEPVLPAADCGPGSRPRLGAEICEPVGWTSCPAGFALDLAIDPSGWGCHADVPATACSGAERDAIGGGCVAVGDCSAPFPPADATYFVDPTFPPASLDANHVLTIGEAVSAAPSSAVIAVAAGTYAESIQPLGPVTIVGACAELVEIVGSGDGKLGMLVDGVADVEVRGVTMRDFLGGVAVYAGGSLRMVDTLIEDQALVGAFVSDAGSLLRLERSVVRHTVAVPEGKLGSGLLAQKGGRLELDEVAVEDSALAGVTSFGDGSTARIERSVIRDSVTQTTGELAGLGGFGIYAYSGGRAELSESIVLDCRSSAVFARKVSAGGTAATVLVERSEVRGTRLDQAGVNGRGIEVSAGATGVVSSSTIALSEEVDLLVTEGSQVTVEGSSVLGPFVDETFPTGHGILVGPDSIADVTSTAVVQTRSAGLTAQDGGTLHAKGSLVRGGLSELMPAPGHLAGSIGLYVYSGALAEVEDCAVVGALGVGALVGQPASRLRLVGSVIADTRPEAAGQFGRAAEAQDGGVLEVERSAFLRNRDVSVLVADGASEASFTDSVVSATAVDGSGLFGHAIVGMGAVRLTLTGTTIEGSAGVAVALSGSAAFLSKCFLSHNAVGVHAQDGSIVAEAESASPDPLLLVVSPDTSFIENGAKVGSGVVPLPGTVSATE